jgi:hypothetical protein
MARKSKEVQLEAVKFRNAVIGINKKIQMGKIGAQLGMRGGNAVILKQIVALDKLCSKVTEKAKKD